jgi:hypothetical protein
MTIEKAMRIIRENDYKEVVGSEVKFRGNNTIQLGQKGDTITVPPQYAFAKRIIVFAKNLANTKNKKLVPKFQKGFYKLGKPEFGKLLKLYDEEEDDIRNVEATICNLDVSENSYNSKLFESKKRLIKNSSHKPAS